MKSLLRLAAFVQIALCLSKQIHVFDCDTEDLDKQLYNDKVSELETRLSDMINQVLKLQEISIERKQWKSVGTIKEINNILQLYPVTEYMYGIVYNSPKIERIVISTWNRGLRIFIRDFYAQGDDGKNLSRGTTLFTYKTDDPQSRVGFYHRYVTTEFKETYNPNKINNELPLYVKRFS